MSSDSLHVEDRIPRLLERLDEVIKAAHEYGYRWGGQDDPGEVRVARAKLDLLKAAFIIECFGGDYIPPKPSRQSDAIHGKREIGNPYSTYPPIVEPISFDEDLGNPDIVTLDDVERMSKGELRLRFRDVGFSNGLTETLLDRLFPEIKRSPEDIMRQHLEADKDYQP